MNVFTNFPALVKELPVTLHHLVHVGAHEGQEMPFYREAGIEKVTLVEPIPELASMLRNRYPAADVVQVACGTALGMATFNVMRRSNLSTLAKPQVVDRVERKITVDVIPLRAIAPTADCAVIDAQGTELDVLKSADLDRYKLVIVETCTVNDSTMASFYDDVASHMESAGYAEVVHWSRDYQWVHKWGRNRTTSKAGEIRDVVYLREAAS